ncbi:hypothetical protein [Chitinophaga varians]|uniref:hypothetical protein n=1 Tax=Chitinophaga varians TaxID=2202339 RepID=UPI00165F02A6|nr:hypothetical protein [Chitinophaga varians]MBC9910844.1 hypothetical protein [Chitinophaga varians]
MKQFCFVLVPKVTMIVLATILIPFVTMHAQERSFAYNNNRFVAEQPSSGIKKDLEVEISQPEKETLNFTLAVINPENEKLTLYIKDSNNNTLHREVLPATVKFEARYNLQSLEDGQYIFEIRSGKNKVAEKSIGIKTQTMVSRLVSVEK